MIDDKYASSDLRVLLLIQEGFLFSSQWVNELVTKLDKQVICICRVHSRGGALD